MVHINYICGISWPLATPGLSISQRTVLFPSISSPQILGFQYLHQFSDFLGATNLYLRLAQSRFLRFSRILRLESKAKVEIGELPTPKGPFKNDIAAKMKFLTPSFPNRVTGGLFVIAKWQFFRPPPSNLNEP